VKGDEGERVEMVQGKDIGPKPFARFVVSRLSFPAFRGGEARTLDLSSPFHSNPNTYGGNLIRGQNILVAISRDMHPLLRKLNSEGEHGSECGLDGKG
jgi:hypothetical protein